MRILEVLNQRQSHCVGFEAEGDISENSSTQFLHVQKNQLLDFQEHVERHWNTLLVSGCNSASYVINFIKNYLLQFS